MGLGVFNENHRFETTRETSHVTHSVAGQGVDRQIYTPAWNGLKTSLEICIIKEVVLLFDVLMLLCDFILTVNLLNAFLFGNWSFGNNFQLKIWIISVTQADSDRSISVVACHGSQVVCATGCDLFYIEILQQQLVQRGHMSLEHEVACLDISPLHEDLETGRAELIAVGLWTDISARILKVP